MLSGQVPADPDEPFFILSLTEIPVGSLGEMGDSTSEPLPLLPVTELSQQQQQRFGQHSAQAWTLFALFDSILFFYPLQCFRRMFGRVARSRHRVHGRERPHHSGRYPPKPCRSSSKNSRNLERCHTACFFFISYQSLLHLH